MQCDNGLFYSSGWILFDEHLGPTHSIDTVSTISASWKDISSITKWHVFKHVGPIFFVLEHLNCKSVRYIQPNKKHEQLFNHFQGEKVETCSF